MMSYRVREGMGSLSSEPPELLPILSLTTPLDPESMHSGCTGWLLPRLDYWISSIMQMVEEKELGWSALESCWSLKSRISDNSILPTTQDEKHAQNLSGVHTVFKVIYIFKTDRMLMKTLSMS